MTGVHFDKNCVFLAQKGLRTYWIAILIYYKVQFDHLDHLNFLSGVVSGLVVLLFLALPHCTLHCSISYYTVLYHTTPWEPNLELTILFGFSKTSDSSDSDFETLLMMYGFGISRLHFTDWSFFGLSWPRFRPITQFRFFTANVVYNRYSLFSVEIFKSE